MEFYRGIILNPIENFDIEYFYNGLLVINKGKIIYCGDYKKGQLSYPEAKKIKKNRQLIIPGLVDLHTHLPQYPVIGTGEGELLAWLNNTIFPTEEIFNNTKFARKVSNRFFKKLIEYGTTTVVIFSNSSLESTDIVFHEAKKVGIRAFIGNSLMDMNAPDNLRYDIKTNISNMMKLIEKWNLHDNGRLNFIVSPRYAGSCSIQLMKEASEIATKNNLFIQTHLAENKDEIRYISSIHNFKGTYTDLLADCGLITSKSLLAHGIHLQAKEIELIKIIEAAIVHCPTSNRYLQSGIMPMNHYRAENLKVGIGTDLAGGYNFSMLDESREAIENSKFYRLYHDNTARILNKKEAFWHSTLGNSIILNLGSKIGNLSKGKEADFVIFEMKSDFNENLIDLDKALSKLLYSDEFRIKGVYVRGKQINKN